MLDGFVLRHRVRPMLRRARGLFRRFRGARHKLAGGEQRLEGGDRVGVDGAAGLLEVDDVAAHQHAQGRGVGALVEHGDDIGAQAMTARFDREIGVVDRIAAGESQRDTQYRTDHLKHGHESGEARAMSVAGMSGMRGIVHPRVKQGIAPGRQHRKPPRKCVAIARHTDFGENFGRD
ncbi:MAG: hypothetical protein P8Y53_19420 [Pseudolabrys sp.]